MFAFSETHSIEIGTRVPDVVAYTHDGKQFDFKETITRNLSLVFFYPKAHTPGCTLQACSLRDSYNDLVSKGLSIYGVSSDTIKSQSSFKDKHSLPYTLISDEGGFVAKAFGKSKWSRQAYLFKDGILVWKDTKGATTKQAKEVIKALVSLDLY